MFILGICLGFNVLAFVSGGGIMFDLCHVFGPTSSYAFNRVNTDPQLSIVANLDHFT